MRWLVATVVVLAQLITGCATGDDAVAQGGTFEFVAPGGRTDIFYDPPESRGRPGQLAGPDLMDPAKTRSLDDFAGEVVVVNVWGQWCGPCRTEIAQLQQVYDATRADGVAFLGIDVRDYNRSAAQDFIIDRDITFPSIYDPPMRTMIAFGGKYPTTVIPSTIVLDREHRVAAVFLARTAGRRPDAGVGAADCRTTRESGSAQPGSAMTGFTEIAAVGPLLLALGVCVLAGLVSFASPCVVPLVPGYLSYLAAVAAVPATNTRAGGVVTGVRWRIAGSAALFVAGFTLVFVLGTVAVLGMTTTLIANQLVLQRIGGVITIVMGLAFIGFIPGVAAGGQVRSPSMVDAGRCPSVGCGFRAWLDALSGTDSGRCDHGGLGH